eukprot:TRINITY_DN6215_c0_g1_i2.p1 TRINITY_DN6215_c0_g1~~TRINITY_DN6215_c0_g1_i2.p1  ORF type:complete len:272 (-),score=44.29 TRINITY_DN6215_c0_g1_i2:151-966(-)
MDLLGNTLESIALHKAGIFRRGVAAITVEQLPEPMATLQKQASAVGAPLTVVPKLRRDIQLGLAGDFQRTNAAAALAACESWCACRRPGLSAGIPAVGAHPFWRGLRECRWPGRAQVVPRGKALLYLDGAHTAESVCECLRWFAESCPAVVAEERERSEDIELALFLTCKSAADSDRIIGHFADAHLPFTRIFFVPYCVVANSREDEATWTALVTSKWAQRLPSPAPTVLLSRAAVFDEMERLAAVRAHVLATGSLYLVAAFFKQFNLSTV